MGAFEPGPHIDGAQKFLMECQAFASLAKATATRTATERALQALGIRK